jgi:hypothetical protein
MLWAEFRIVGNFFTEQVNSVRTGNLLFVHREEAASKLEAGTTNFEVKLKKLRGLDETKFNGICHGDVWTNNIMFRHSSGRPTEAKFVIFFLSNIIYFHIFPLVIGSRYIHNKLSGVTATPEVDEFSRRIGRIVFNTGLPKCRRDSSTISGGDISERILKNIYS